MIHFTRTATVKATSFTTPAVGFARELVGYLKKTYNVDVRVGVELFGRSNIHWTFETDDLNTLHDLNTRLMQDREYVSMLDRGNEYWVEGSLRDRVITIID